MNFQIYISIGKVLINNLLLTFLHVVENNYGT